MRQTLFFCVCGTWEDPWRKIYQWVNRLHESLVYSVLLTTCSNTFFIITQTDLSWHKYLMFSEFSFSFFFPPFLLIALPHLKFCGYSPGAWSWCLTTFFCISDRIMQVWFLVLLWGCWHPIQGTFWNLSWPHIRYKNTYSQVSGNVTVFLDSWWCHLPY